MVEITLLELSFPDAQFSGEAAFNAPFAGRGSADESAESGADTDEGTPADGPPAASVAALLVGLVSVAVLVWLRGRGSRGDDGEPDDD